MVGTQPLIWIVDDSPTQRAIILLAAASAQSSRAREEFGSHEDVLRAAPDFATYARESGMRALVVLKLPVPGLVKGVVTLTRDGHSDPFDEGDLAAITTCLEITGLAIATAMRSEADRVEIRFHQEMIGIVSHDLRSHHVLDRVRGRELALTPSR